MEVGQVILLTNIDCIGGQKQSLFKTVRPAIVRTIHSPNHISVRLLTTIYTEEKEKPLTLANAKKELYHHLKKENLMMHQVVLLCPEKDGILDYSYVYGNLYTCTFEVNRSNVTLLWDSNHQPVMIDRHTEQMIAEAETQAAIEQIQKEYVIEFHHEYDKVLGQSVLFKCQKM